ncbi:MAG: helix-turn-helix transcriptional regulator [Candidatus Binatia bacterium]|nr:helix-turn-helix transcriptional regulator [Candidatus Binatia bacterium]
MKRKTLSTTVYKMRRKTKLNQTEFWNRVGITQSGGSRYEHGRAMPEPVAMLVRMVHHENGTMAHAVLRKLRRE